MRIEITVPGWGDVSVEEAVLANWFITEGTLVTAGQVLGEVMAEKVNVEVIAPNTGVIQHIRLHRGDVVRSGMVIAELVTDAMVADTPAHSVATTSPPTRADGAFVPAFPAARRLARELGVDLTQVVPRDGERVTEDDVRKAANAVNPSSSPSSEPVAIGMPLSGRRKVIAERMLRSLQTAAQLTLTTDVRADALVAARAKVSTISYTDLIAWVVVRALQVYPAMNATLVGDQLTQYTSIHLGLAVAAPDGLVVPVIRDAGNLTLGQIAERTRELSERARANTSLPGELSGSTFSLTTLGKYDIDAFTPILNPPEVAILGVGRIREAIVPENGQAVVGYLMALSLTFDHRAVDGAPAAEFLQAVKRMIEMPTTYSAIQ